MTRSDVMTNTNVLYKIYKRLLLPVAVFIRTQVHRGKQSELQATVCEAGILCVPMAQAYTGLPNIPNFLMLQSQKHQAWRASYYPFHASSIPP